MRCARGYRGVHAPHSGLCKIELAGVHKTHIYFYSGGVLNWELLLLCHIFSCTSLSSTVAHKLFGASSDNLKASISGIKDSSTVSSPC